MMCEPGDLNCSPEYTNELTKLPMKKARFLIMAKVKVMDEWYKETETKLFTNPLFQQFYDRILLAELRYRINEDRDKRSDKDSVYI